MTLPIEDYAVIGDRHTAALVGTNGSIDWLCLPRFDSPACLAALLGSEENGCWQLSPTTVDRVARRYVGDSCALETRFDCPDGVVSLTDVMPEGNDRADIVRVLRGVRGRVRVRHVWRVRPDYGKVRPWVRRLTTSDGEEAISAVAGPDRLILHGDRLPQASDGVHTDEFWVEEGDELTFVLTWVPAYVDPAAVAPELPQVADVIAADEEWAARFTLDVPHPDVVRRSLVTLRLMTDSRTGGIVAAPTTSLPEDFGGVRNWDYRYCWLRDAALTVATLVRAGYVDEADLWRRWLLRAVAGDPEDLQIMYAVDGARRLPEFELPHLRGYADSRPVRIGNGAVEQRQHDVLGEVMDALHLLREEDGGADRDAWALQRRLLEHAADHWQEPDFGIWEIRGEPRPFVHSRVMTWVAFDRAVRAVEDFGLDGPVERWRRVRDDVRAEILERGVDRTRGCFVQHYDTDEVDASLLLIPTVGFLPGDDPRVLSTIAAVEEDLLRGSSPGLVLRYRTSSGVDGLAGDDHPFLACSFWLVRAYALAGRTEDAHRLFDGLVGLTNEVGLLAEEYDPVHDRMVGNFPQAFSHLALVNAALALGLDDVV